MPRLARVLVNFAHATGLPCQSGTVFRLHFHLVLWFIRPDLGGEHMVNCPKCGHVFDEMAGKKPLSPSTGDDI
jgi:hypothetical protein